MSKEIMRKNIARAQAYIDQKKEIVKLGRMRQDYHFMAQTGWINDPNGLIYYKGKYHIFYQYNPYYGHWDYMHWGHAVSGDLVRWEHLSLALAPSETYDDHYRGGCFSGSAIEHDGKLFLMYTGCTNNGNGFEQTQCIAFSEDGIHFEKYEGNPVLTAPEGVPKHLFRDPKVWEHDGKYYMICGASKKNLAQALLYVSEDMFHWDFFSVLAQSRGEWGYMWECPDFFPLGDKYVLLVSPMGAGERTCVYMVGDFSYETGKFVWNVSGEIDWGFDFYAPQSFVDGKGRRIVIGWANAWDWMPFWKDWGPTYREGWCGSFAVPRQIKMNADHTLSFEPVEELETLRGKATVQENVLLKGGREDISLQDGYAYELKMEVDLKETTASAFSLLLRCSQDRTRQTKITFDLKRQHIYFDRDHADGWSRGVSHSPLRLEDPRVFLVHIFVDTSSIEVFAEDYKTNHSCNVFADRNQDKNFLSVPAGNLKIRSIQTWSLEKTIDR